MKHLILIRHAESGEKVTGQSDKDRELTTSGISQAASAGAYLRDQPVHIDMILSSGASRAETTAQLIAEQLKSGDLITVEDELYQGSVGTLFNILRGADQHQSIAIVGHNPTVSYFSEFITGTVVEELRPATVIVFKVPIGNWKDLSKGCATLLDRFDA
ncbi:MAG TPA: histidine phosphatase family protein [Cyclobacteriaceae bacterium]|nr:histidine phosphatase family protein [Cyclobacteriaceae bacterium]